MAENKEYKEHQHEFTYTDHMNKYLLSSLYQQNNAMPSLQNLPMLNKAQAKEEEDEEPNEFE